jgi:hypothetical protein
MQIVYHLGAHCTDEGNLLRVLLRNRAALAGHGIAVPEPDRYPDLLRAAAAAFAGQPPNPDAAQALLAALAPDGTDRLVLSFESLLAFPRDAVTGAMLYPAAAARAQALATLFPQAEVEFLLAIRNPATWVPALSAKRRSKGQDPLPDGFDARALRWSDLVARLVAAVPGAGVTVWCDEDSPLIWHRILRALADQPEAMDLAGALAFPSGLMSAEGAQALAAWFAQARPATDAARRDGIAAQLERHALPDRMETAIDLPGWTADTVATLSAAYDADLDRIAALEGARLLLP